MSDFVNIAGTRIRKSTIKRYSALNSTKINVFYNTSRYKVDVEAFSFPSEKERDALLETLDKTL